MPILLSQLFELLCIQTASDLLDATFFARTLQYGEETITERFLLDLARHQGKLPKGTVRVLSIAHVKYQGTWRSEPKTGADWEWHFGTPSSKKWFSIRVQAKKAAWNKKHAWGYDDIGTIPKKKIGGKWVPQKRQIEKLIDQANKHKCWPLYALYDRHFLASAVPLSRCSTCPRAATAFMGVTYADANAMQTLIPNKLGRDAVRAISAPMPCIVDCPTVLRPIRSLPERVKDFADQLRRRSLSSLDGTAPIPEMSDGLPPHVAELLRSVDDAVPDGPLIRVNGEWRFGWDPDVGDEEVGPEEERPDAYDDLAGMVIIQGGAEEP